MKIPKKLKIGGHIFKIDCSKELKDMDGECARDENTLRICKTLPQNQKEVTLIHEIFHALNASFDEGNYHMILDSLSEQFYQVLVDNKLLK